MNQPNYLEIYEHVGRPGFGWSIGSDKPGSDVSGHATTLDEAMLAAQAAITKMKEETT